MKVSIIVITYNQENYISKTLDSILSQKFNFKYEILIGDDASTDNTANIIMNYKKKYPNNIRIFIREKNIGASRNAYELCKKAKGEYLAFCEGDDYWIDRYKLCKQINFLDENKEYIGCYHKCVLIDNNDKKLKYQRLSWVKYKNRFTFKDFKGGIYLPGQTATVVKRNIFKEYKKKYDILYKCNRNISDRISAEIFLLQGDFHCIDEYMSVYRITDKSVTFNKYKRYNSNTKYIEDWHFIEKLERYATKESGKDIVFSHKRCMIFSGFIVNCLRDLSSVNKKDFYLICKDKKLPWFAGLYLIYFVISRSIMKLIR